MKVLLTGSTGFLGKHILKDLLDHCDHIYVLIRKKSFLKAKELFSDEKKISIVVGDLLNMDLIEETPDLKEVTTDEEEFRHWEGLEEDWEEFNRKEKSDADRKK